MVEGAVDIQEMVAVSKSEDMKAAYNRYRDSLKNTPKPVLPSALSGKHIDLKGLMAYAKNKNISPADLTEQEKKCFISD